MNAKPEWMEPMGYDETQADVQHRLSQSQRYSFGPAKPQQHDSHVTAKMTASAIAALDAMYAERYAENHPNDL